MINLYITATKYIQLLLIALYTYCNFRFLSIPDQDDANPLCDWQLRIILLVHFLMNLTVFLKTGEVSALIFYVLQLIFFILYTYFSVRIYRNINRLLLNNTVFFLAYGLITLERLDMGKAIKQFVIVIGAAAMTLVVPYIIDKIWDLKRWRYHFAVFGILMQGIVFVIGATSYGAKMSISIGGFTFQASEIVKITFVLATAGMLSKAESFRDIVITSIVAGAHMLILVMCKDLGSALIFFVAYLVILFIATNSLFYLIFGNLSMCLAAVFSYFSFSHVRTRVFAWLDPWADIDNKGYQITQSLFAIGTGGFAGLGLYQGLPNKIPIVEKDFIISAISEEMGAVTAICITLVCLGCFMQMMVIGTYMEDSFYKYVSVGLAIEYIVQVFLTIGGAIKFIPSTGVTLPFVSYGGSSLVSAFIVFAIIQALYIIQGNEDEADEREVLDNVSGREVYNGPDYSDGGYDEEDFYEPDYDEKVYDEYDETSYDDSGYEEDYIDSDFDEEDYDEPKGRGKSSDRSYKNEKIRAEDLGI
ncbi:FtsW/RodA/SpoVE family cell cycle protein [Oribacterium sp. P6A1]|uniref:FtsW/RodA/SpoVE family cell cycle protein n=1 Tax=Oribacterium sp. P6A1 TaxID=1410612 RepID=UPI0009DCA199|nr:FtsW/RodA/SpoVE family cell cycle protein [Oribacterium sp. P6A1]